MILHAFWRSGASYRTRIALNLKGLSYEVRVVNLRAGEQGSAEYRLLNPQGMLPALEVGDAFGGAVLTQSPAILEWLEETHPEPPLLPTSPEARAVVRAMAAIPGADMQPLTNLRILKALREDFGADDAAIDRWAGRWNASGLAALEALVARHGDGWAYGATPTLADCYLIPQLYSARRFNVSLDAYPRLLAIEAASETHPAFIAAHPDNQPDAVGA